MTHFEALHAALAPLRKRLIDHPLYTQVNSLPTLRTFMESHVFAVWDFMSLAKRLQRDLTCVDVPWLPPRNGEVARFINEVVLAEESDIGLDSKPISHLEMYLRAMREVDAPTETFEAFIESLRDGTDSSVALLRTAIPTSTQQFVRETLRCAREGHIVEAASAFFFGREDVIPDMFERLLGLWDDAKTQVPHYAYYLERHIELDGDEHGPVARRMLIHLAGDEPVKWELAKNAALRAIKARIMLWDGVAAELGLATTPQLALPPVER